MLQRPNGSTELQTRFGKTFVLRLGHRGGRFLHHATRAGLFRLLRRALCCSHQGIWLEPHHHLLTLFCRSGGICHPDLARWPPLRPLWAALVVSIRCVVSGSGSDHQRAGAYALAPVPDLGAAGQPGYESQWFRPAPDADVVVVPSAAWSRLWSGAQWCQYRCAGTRAGDPVCGESLRLASGLHGAWPARDRLPDALEYAVTTPSPG